MDQDLSQESAKQSYHILVALWIGRLHVRYLYRNRCCRQTRGLRSPLLNLE